MLKRYEDALMQRFDAVAYKGFAFIEWWELNAWYDMDRISKKRLAGSAGTIRRSCQ